MNFLATWKFAQGFLKSLTYTCKHSINYLPRQDRVALLWLMLSPLPVSHQYLRYGITMTNFSRAPSSPSTCARKTSADAET
ncbi:hypothetical protein GE21DRAFT_1222484 [Neurospora crassa]|nr:hypothetical protein GE21DRAFT_1222484 [Neurospora crassa]